MVWCRKLGKQSGIVGRQHLWGQSSVQPIWDCWGAWHLLFDMCPMCGSSCCRSLCWLWHLATWLWHLVIWLWHLVTWLWHLVTSLCRLCCLFDCLVLAFSCTCHLFALSHAAFAPTACLLLAAGLTSACLRRFLFQVFLDLLGFLARCCCWCCCWWSWAGASNVLAFVVRAIIKQFLSSRQPTELVIGLCFIPWAGVCWSNMVGWGGQSFVITVKGHLTGYLIISWNSCGFRHRRALNRSRRVWSWRSQRQQVLFLLSQDLI